MKTIRAAHDSLSLDDEDDLGGVIPTIASACGTNNTKTIRRQLAAMQMPTSSGAADMKDYLDALRGQMDALTNTQQQQQCKIVQDQEECTIQMHEASQK